MTTEIEPQWPTQFAKDISYANYLNLHTILSAAKPTTEEPLELLFIIAHQTTELWFKVLIVELQRIIAVPADIHPSYSPVVQLQRIIKILEHLTTLWAVLATMQPEEYVNFRSNLGSASGMQSVQYKEVEELLRKLPERWMYKYKYHLLDIENAFKKWQFAHMKTVERIIGSDTKGTGGTTGVAYLKAAVDTELYKREDDGAYRNDTYEWKDW